MMVVRYLTWHLNRVERVAAFATTLVTIPVVLVSALAPAGLIGSDFINAIFVILVYWPFAVLMTASSARWWMRRRPVILTIVTFAPCALCLAAATTLDSHAEVLQRAVGGFLAVASGVAVGAPVITRRSSHEPDNIPTRPKAVKP